MAGVVAQVDLAGARDFLFGVEEHLFPLGDPAGGARDGEQDREHRGREAHRLVDEAGVEVDIGVELALHEVVVFQGDALALQRDFEQRVLAHQIEDVVGDLFDDAGARVVIFVDAVAEAHEFGFAGLDALDEIRNFLHGTNFHQHANDFFVGAAVERAVERGDCRGRGGVRIDVRATDAADGVGGAILFVVSVEDEEDVESVFESGIRAIPRFGGAKQHVQEIAGIAQIVVGIDERHTERVAVGEGRDRGHFADQAIGLFLARLGAEDVFGVVIVRRECGDGGDQHAHGMGVVMEAVEKFLDALVNECVVGDVIGPRLELLGGGEFAVEEEVRGFEVGALFGEIFDRVAAIAEDAGVAVDVGDLADAGGGVVEGGVVTHHPEIGRIDLDLTEIGGADGVVGDGELVGFAGAIVGDGEGLARRGGGVGLFGLSGCGSGGFHERSLGARRGEVRLLINSTPKAELREWAERVGRK